MTLPTEIQSLLEPELPVADAAEPLGISPQSVVRAIERGKLAARDAAIQESDRRDWRLPLSHLIELRNSYDLQACAKKSNRVRGFAQKGC
jgi:hypothetical protein